jgi:hypothetical protein
MKNLKPTGGKAVRLMLQITLIVLILIVGFWSGSRPAPVTSENQTEASVHSTH